DTPRSRAPSVTCASRSTTRWRWRSRLKCDRPEAEFHVRGLPARYRPFTTPYRAERLAASDTLVEECRGSLLATRGVCASVGPQRSCGHLLPRLLTALHLTPSQAEAPYSPTASPPATNLAQAGHPIPQPEQQ